MPFLDLESNQRKLLFLLLFGVLMGALDIAIIGPALPAIKSELNINIQDSSWIINIYLIAHLVAVPLFAKLSDIYGRRYIYILNIFLFAVGSLVIYFSDSLVLLLIGRTIQGLGAGGIFPIASAVIGDTIPKEKQGTALGIIGAVFGVAYLIGPILGGILLYWNWRMIFLINIPFASIIIFFASRIIPINYHKLNKKLDILGIILFSVILVSISIAFNSINITNLTDNLLNPNLFLLLLAILLFPLFIIIEKKSFNPLINLKLFSNQKLVLSYILGFGAGIAQSCGIFIPLFTKENFDVSNSTASFMLIPMVLAMMVGAPTAGRIIDKKGVRMTLQLGSISIFIGFMVFILWGYNLIGFYLSGIAIGLGLSFLLGAPLRYLVNTNTDSSMRASGQGVVSVSTSSGHIIATALIGAILNTSINYNFVNYQISFSILAFISIIMILVASKIDN